MIRSIGHLTNEYCAAIKPKLVGDQLSRIRLVQNRMKIYGRFILFDLHPTARVVIVRMPLCHLARKFCPLCLVVEVITRFRAVLNRLQRSPVVIASDLSDDYFFF